MSLNENDLSYLIDIVDCIMDITEFTESIQYYQFEKDKMRKLAVERQLEVIGQTEEITFSKNNIADRQGI